MNPQEQRPDNGTRPAEPVGDDRCVVAELLGRAPRGAFTVVVRHDDGDPLVILNAPLLDDGTPMPTRHWLVGEPQRTMVSRLESAGGVARAEAAVEPAALAATHAAAAAERSAALPPDHRGPAPGGGVGGTARGVKCLHAHYARHLAGAADPVGAWVAAELMTGRWDGIDGWNGAASQSGVDGWGGVDGQDGVQLAGPSARAGHPR